MERLGRHARRLQTASPPTPVPAPDPQGTTRTGDEQVEADPRTRQIQLLLEKMFGIKRIASLDLRLDASHAAVAMGQVSERMAQAQGQSGGAAGWGLSYDYRETYAEVEVLALNAEGTFTTDDGRRFTFNLDYRMERTFVQERSVSLRMGDAVVRDPLMLDLGGGGGGFAAGTVPLDLDGDGRMEALPLPKAGNWYLLRNGQTPTTGRDLFGPATGQGFMELAALDGDGNGFIDSGDAGFSGLHLWNGLGPPALLASLGVGAIATRGIDAPFRHADAANALLGLNRQSGLWLGEDGRAGIVHQVDVAV